MKTTWNIGLNNNPYNAQDIIGAITTAFPHNEGYIVAYREHMGEWEGKPEPTLVIEVLGEQDTESMVILTKMMCLAFTQDAIAVRNNDDGVLVYNPKHEGEQYTFDPQYFHEI
jgi:hypothetical protein